MIAATVLLSILFSSQQVSPTAQAATVKKKEEVKEQSKKSAQPPQTPSPTRIVVDSPITIAKQPDPKEEERYAAEQAQARFESRLQIFTLIFAAVAAAGAIGAYRANKREAKAAERQVAILEHQIKDAKDEAIEQRRIAQESLAETRNPQMPLRSARTL